jgi:NADH-quinone oxidoreductase subunit N
MLSNLLAIGPELALTATVLLVLIADLLIGDRPARRASLATVAFAGLAAAAAAFALLPDGGPSAFDGMVSGDGLGRFFRGLFLVAAFFGVAFGALSDEIPARRFGEYTILLLSTTLGMCFLVSAQNLLMILLALELTSLPSYILAGFRRGDRRSSEAALKYVLYGAAASGLMLYGFSLLYGMAGTLDLAKVGPALNASAAGGSVAIRAGIAVAALLSLVGFGYKIAAVPFHQWAPDVYEGAPTPVTAFLSVGPKAAGVAALIRFVVVGFGASVATPPAGGLPWPMLLGILAMATMTLGNLAAIPQDNVKRLLAYSSIAHAGYLLMGVAVGTPEAIQAIALYMPIYLLMNLGAFLAVLAVRAKTGSETIAAYRGLGTRSPFLAVCLAIFLFSLTGVPPFAGFIGKFYLFAAVLKAGTPFFYIVALVGVLNSVVSLFYYARLVKALFLEASPTGAPVVAVPFATTFLLAVLAIPTLLMGIWWSPLASLAAKAAGIAE